MNNGHVLEFLSSMLSFSSFLSKERLEFFSVPTWTIWHERNYKGLFEGLSAKAKSTSYKAQNCIEEYKAANDCQNLHSWGEVLNLMQVWKALTLHSFKFNVDDALEYFSGGQSGFVVISNQDGILLW